MRERSQVITYRLAFKKKRKEPNTILYKIDSFGQEISKVPGTIIAII